MQSTKASFAAMSLGLLLIGGIAGYYLSQRSQIVELESSPTPIGQCFPVEATEALFPDGQAAIYITFPSPLPLEDVVAQVIEPFGLSAPVIESSMILGGHAFHDSYPIRGSSSLQNIQDEINQYRLAFLEIHSDKDGAASSIAAFGPEYAAEIETRRADAERMFLARDPGPIL